MRTKLILINPASQISCHLLPRIAKTMVLMLGMVIVFIRTYGMATNEILTTISQVRSLTAAQAAGKISVSVTGVVTETERSWGGCFFVQDSTGGVYVNNTNEPPPLVGDLIQIGGVSDNVGFTPSINSKFWKKIGTAPLPEAHPISAQELLAGGEDANRVEVTGFVISSSQRGKWLRLQLESGGLHFWANGRLAAELDPRSFIGTSIRVRGTASTSVATSGKNRISVTLFVPNKSDVIVEQPTNTEITTDLLTTAVQILSLSSAEAARYIPVSVTGVVTAAQSNWGGRFFIQDSTAGVFVDSTNCPQPALGDLVHVTGIASPGGFAPDIHFPYWRKLGEAPLPEAKQVSMEQFLSGSEDGERIELSGVVTMAEVVKTWLKLELKSSGDRAKAYVPLPIDFNKDSLVGATVRIRGTAAASFNPRLRNLLTVFLFAQMKSDFIVDQLPNQSISNAPFTSISDIAQYRRNDSPDFRIRVKGVVTYQRPGEDIFLHDRTGGLQVQTYATNVFVPGDLVEAIGFPGVKDFLPVLEDAILIPAGESEEPVVPKKVTLPELLKGYHHADLVSLRGKLLDRSLRFLENANSLTNMAEENVLTLKSDKYFVTVDTPANGEFAKLATVPIGSTLEVSGVCLLEADEKGEVESIHILPVDSGSIRILKRSSWWTPNRLLIALGILFVASLVGISWIFMIHRKNSVLKLSIEERIKAQDELQKAHDQLEARVVERTRELTFEMSARREAEIVLTERTRLAQELHDTVLQGFTGIGLKLDSLASTLPPSLADTKEQMEKILRQSDEYLDEARRSVWQLRSFSLEKDGNFPEALKKAGERPVQGTSIDVDFAACGTPYKLTPEVEDNFLRICEEAVTNAVKHASPTRIEVILEYSPDELRLRVRDDGCGFNTNGLDRSNEGHFGLVGIRERAKSLSGNLCVTSQQNHGTEILVTIKGKQNS